MRCCARAGAADAVPYYRKVIAGQPRTADPFVGLASAHAERGRLDERAACCSRALAVDPASGQVHYNLGEVARVQGDVETAARAAYKSALDDPVTRERARRRGWQRRSVKPRRPSSPWPAAWPRGAGRARRVRRRRRRGRGASVLLVTIDTLRADRVGAYGAKTGATPAPRRPGRARRRVRGGAGFRAAHPAVARHHPERTGAAASRRARQRHATSSPRTAPTLATVLEGARLRDGRVRRRLRARPAVRPGAGVRPLRRPHRAAARGRERARIGAARARRSRTPRSNGSDARPGPSSPGRISTSRTPPTIRPRRIASSTPAGPTTGEVASADACFGRLVAAAEARAAGTPRRRRHRRPRRGARRSRRAHPRILRVRADAARAPDPGRRRASRRGARRRGPRAHGGHPAHAPGPARRPAAAAASTARTCSGPRGPRRLRGDALPARRWAGPAARARGWARSSTSTRRAPSSTTSADDPGETRNLVAERPRTRSASAAGWRALRATRARRHGRGRRSRDRRAAARARLRRRRPRPRHERAAPPRPQGRARRLAALRGGDLGGRRAATTRRAVAALRALVRREPGNAAFRQALAAALRAPGRPREAAQALGCWSRSRRRTRGLARARARPRRRRPGWRRRSARSAARSRSTRRCPSRTTIWASSRARGQARRRRSRSSTTPSRLDPNNAGAWTNRANALRAMGRRREAARPYQTAMRAGPARSGAAQRPGRSCREDGRARPRRRAVPGGARRRPPLPRGAPEPRGRRGTARTADVARAALARSSSAPERRCPQQGAAFVPRGCS